MAQLFYGSSLGWLMLRYQGCRRSRMHRFMLAGRQIGHCFLAIMVSKPDALTRQIVSSVQQIENSNRFICNNLSRETVRYTSRRGAMPPPI